MLHVKMGDTKVGRLVLTQDQRVAFEYDKEFLNSGFSISPFHLPLKQGVFLAETSPFDGNFGVFNDSLPDGWGNFILARYLASQGISLDSQSLLDRLSRVGSKGMGVLEYYPEGSVTSSISTQDLNFLAKEVGKVLTEPTYSEHLHLLAENGCIPGGVRPKVLYSYNNEDWIVKFHSPSDPPNMGMSEFVNSKIARKCGIPMSPSRLFEGKYFGIKRFDVRSGNRLHMVSVSGLLNASHRKPALDYVDLIKATFVLTKNIKDCYQLFRRMVYNVLTGNRNDHSKNFSFLFEAGEWKLSPAYDMVPDKGLNGNHATRIAGHGQPEKTHIFEVAKLTGLKPSRISDIFDEVYTGCSPIRLSKF